MRTTSFADWKVGFLGADCDLPYRIPARRYVDIDPHGRVRVFGIGCRPTWSYQVWSMTWTQASSRSLSQPADEGLVIRDIWLLRLRALLARAHGNAPLTRYRAMAASLGFEGRMKWAEAMP